MLTLNRPHLLHPLPINHPWPGKTPQSIKLAVDPSILSAAADEAVYLGIGNPFTY